MKQRYEHDFYWYVATYEIARLIQERERDGWEVAAVMHKSVPGSEFYSVIFKRPVDG
jgi:hypothetical protein